MKLVRTLSLLAFMVIFTSRMWGEEARPYYHSFNSEPPSSFTFKPTTVKIVSRPRSIAARSSHYNAVYDSSNFFMWDSILAGWQIKTRLYYKSYDANKNLLFEIGKTLNNGVWENSFSNSYIYDSKHNVISKVFSTWIGGAWVKQKKDVYTYNSNNEITSYIVTQFTGSAWSNVSKSVVVFDSKNNKISESYYDGVGSGWTNNYQYIYSYDGNNNRLSEDYQLGLGSDSTWKSVAKWSYVYDTRHNRLSELNQNWDFGTGAFVNAAMFLYQYDANNNMTQQVSQNWEDEGWVNSVRISNTYDGNNKIKEFAERWNEETSAWEDRLLTSFAYDKNNDNTHRLVQEFINDKWVNVSNLATTYDHARRKAESIEQEWKNQAWLNREKFIYTYNSNGDCTWELNQKWSETKKWFHAYYILKAYDHSFVKTDESYKSWNIVTDKNDTNTPFITGDSTHFFIHKEIATGLQETPTLVKDNNLMIYPNPSNGVFNVVLDNEHPPIQNLEVYDSTGKMILKQQSKQITIPNAIPGIYYLKLERDATHYSQRIIVQ
jgi:hypothetical protein